MLLPIPRVSLSQLLIMDHQKILRIISFGGFGEIKASGNHGLPVDDHYLVMGNGVGSINFHGYPIISEKGG